MPCQAEPERGRPERPGPEQHPESVAAPRGEGPVSFDLGHDRPAELRNPPEGGDDAPSASVREFAGAARRHHRRRGEGRPVGGRNPVGGSRLASPFGSHQEELVRLGHDDEQALERIIAGPGKMPSEGVGGVHGHENDSVRPARVLQDGLGDRDCEGVGALSDRMGHDRSDLGQRPARRLEQGGVAPGRAGRRGGNPAAAVEDSDLHARLFPHELVQSRADVRRSLRVTYGSRAAGAHERPDALEPPEEVGLPAPVVDRALGDGQPVVRQASQARLPLRARRLLAAADRDPREDGQENPGQRPGHEQPDRDRPLGGGRRAAGLRSGHRVKPAGVPRPSAGPRPAR